MTKKLLLLEKNWKVRIAGMVYNPQEQSVSSNWNDCWWSDTLIEATNTIQSQ